MDWQRAMARAAMLLVVASAVANAVAPPHAVAVAERSSETDAHSAGVIEPGRSTAAVARTEWPRRGAAGGSPTGGLAPTSINLYLYAGGQTGIQVQNLDETQDATIVADFYTQGGPSGGISVQLPVTEAGAAANIYLPSEPRLAGGEFGVIVAADRMISAIARKEWPGTGRAAAYGQGSPAMDTLVPLAVRDYVGQSSLIIVQNTDPTAEAYFDLELIEMGQTEALKTVQGRIPPGTAATLDLGRDWEFADVPDGFLGWARVQAATPLSAHAFVYFVTSPDVVYAFEGTSLWDAAERLYAPLVRREFYGTTGISVVNPTSMDARVTVTFRGGGAGVGSSCAGRTYEQGPVTVRGGSGVVFYQGDADVAAAGRTPLPKGCLGSAVIHSEGAKVVAIVNDASGGYPPASSAAYNAFPDRYGARNVALPLVRNRHMRDTQMSTGVQVMNVGDSKAAVRLTPRPLNCELAPDVRLDAEIAPFESHTYYFPDIGSLPPDWFGSAVINSSEPVVAIVNDISLTGRLDAAIYSGIKADWPAGPPYP